MTERVCEALGKHKRHYFAAVIAVPLVVGLLGLGNGHAWGRRSSSSLRSRRWSTFRKIKNVRASLRAVKQQQKQVTGQIDAADRRLQEAKDRRDDAAAQLKATQAQLRQTKAEIEKTQKKLHEHEAALAERLRAAHKKGPATYIGVILGSTDFTDLSTRTYFCQKIVQADTDLLISIQQTKKRLDIQRETLERKERARRRLLERIKAEQAQIARAKAAKQRTLKQIMADRAALEQALDELEAESKALEAEIRRWTAPGSRYRYTGHFSGGLGNPCPGARFTSGFGYRFHPILHKTKMHTGVDLAAPYGTPIRAAADGMVVFVGWRRGYGKTVVIDHGSGISTLYGHCASYLVSPGQFVRRGEAIARVDSTGLSTGNHLHFEKRVDGVPVNPM